mmetsp:Transcript_18287/g.38264  ORF Transcript_18287/g.38264 Transcript_18287/m.38264 type:complete len:91 (-) Transcript_18287:412-684(-)
MEGYRSPDEEEGGGETQGHGNGEQNVLGGIELSPSKGGVQSIRTRSHLAIRVGIRQSGGGPHERHLAGVVAGFGMLSKLRRGKKGLQEVS